MEIREIIVEDAVGQYINQVVITNDDGSTITMPKSVYDEMIANQASGTIS